MGYAVKIYEAFKDDEIKAKLLSEFIELVEQAILNNQLATRQDVTLSELKLTREIEQTRGEIKEVELKLTREIEQTRGEIKEVELKLTREIEQIRGEIKEVELKLTREIEQVRADVTEKINDVKIGTIRWIVTLFITQTITILGIIAGLFQVMK
ncbi:MAG TPA: hypothetical protein PLZ38_13785 [Spirochaetota bacterium]|nr:hypothetical protein [Spirochaetota bacterium]